MQVFVLFNCVCVAWGDMEIAGTVNLGFLLSESVLYNINYLFVITLYSFNKYLSLLLFLKLTVTCMCWMHPECVLCTRGMPAAIQAGIFFLSICYLKAVEWRRQQNEELYDLYSSPDIFWVIRSRRLRWVGHVAHTCENGGTQNVSMMKFEGNRPPGKPWHRWEG